MDIRMQSFLKIVALLAAVAGICRGNDYPCQLAGRGLLDCTGLELTMPPPGYWEAITNLALKENPITEIPKNSLSGFPAVRYFSILNTPLADVDFGELAAMPELYDIVIQNNQIETLTPPTDESLLPNLEYIYGNGNNIAKIDPDFFLIAPKLHFLAINNNPFVVEAGQPFLNHPELRTLYVGTGSDSFHVIEPVLLSGLPNLRWITLRSAQITSIAGAFVNNPLLETIHLDDNAITEITSGTFASEGLITTLNLAGNPLRRLDTAALNKAMAQGGLVSIKNTPLACQCLYEALYWWAAYKGVSLDVACDDAQPVCSYASRLQFRFLFLNPPPVPAPTPAPAPTDALGYRLATPLQ